MYPHDSIRPAQGRVRGVREERGDTGGVLLDGHRFVCRDHRRAEQHRIGIVALIMLGNGVAEPVQVALECGLVGLLFTQAGIVVGLLGEAPQQEVELYI